MESLLPFIGWAILPKYATSFLQYVYYGITIRGGEARPAQGSPRYERHRRRIFLSVIVFYLLYTLYETFHHVQTSGDYYKVLGVSPFADERTIKSRFRRLAAQHHPDKVGFNAGSEATFLFLRQVQETLADPVKRFAYDRFGPDMQTWGEQKTMHDFLIASLTRSVAPQYLITFVTMVLLNWLWWANWGRYWRFYTFGAMITLEVALITHPQAVFMPLTYLPASIRGWLPDNSFYLLPFQILTVARRASINLHIFISQVAPSSSPPVSGDQIAPQTLKRVSQLLDITRATGVEATRLHQLSLAPFRGDPASVNALRRGMKEGLILGGVRASPEVQRAVTQVLKRRQATGNDLTR